jgi:hypothetical protein
MEIDPKIRACTFCDRDFECLKNKNYFCSKSKPKGLLGDDKLIVDCPKVACDYRIQYANMIVCNCPTRVEIFKQYKK